MHINLWLTLLANSLNSHKMHLCTYACRVAGSRTTLKRVVCAVLTAALREQDGLPCRLVLRSSLWHRLGNEPSQLYDICPFKHVNIQTTPKEARK